MMARSVGRDGVPSPSEMGVGAVGGGTPTLPVRKRLDHRGPLSIDVSGAWYFITICAAVRVAYGRDGVPSPSDGGAVGGGTPTLPGDAVGGGTPTLPGMFMPVATDILECARQYHIRGKWKLALFLVMPDHMHFIVHVPAVGGGTPTLPHVIGHWKHYVAEHFGVSFQKDFWDTRLRDEAHYGEKFRYICNNPVRKALCKAARDWPYVIAFDRETGEERQHK